MMILKNQRNINKFNKFKDIDIMMILKNQRNIN